MIVVRADLANEHIVIVLPRDYRDVAIDLRSVEESTRNMQQTGEA